MQPFTGPGRQDQQSSSYDTVPAASEPLQQQGSQLDVEMRDAGDTEEQERVAKGHWVKASQVERVRHLTRSDEIVFTDPGDPKGRRISSSRGQWVGTRYNGNKA